MAQQTSRQPVDLQTALNKLGSNYGLPAAFPQFAMAAAVLLDENNLIQFDARDLAGTMARLAASAEEGLTLPAGQNVVRLSANGVAEIEDDGDPIAEAVLASLSTNLTGNNNDLVFTSVLLGSDGNALQIEYIDPADISIPLSVEVVGNTIQFTLETDGAGVIATIADDITALATSDLEDYVTVADKAANDGTGLVTAMAATALAGGLGDEDLTGYGFAGPGSRFTNYSDGEVWINTGTAAAPVWEQLAVV